MTDTGVTERARENAPGSLSNVKMEPVLREEQSVETTSASAMALIMTLSVPGVITPTTGENVMEPASKIGIHATRLVSLDTNFAKNTKTEAMAINTTGPDA